jgi:hypothetical protein
MDVEDVSDHWPRAPRSALEATMKHFFEVTVRWFAPSGARQLAWDQIATIDQALGDPDFLEFATRQFVDLDSAMRSLHHRAQRIGLELLPDEFENPMNVNMDGESFGNAQARLEQRLLGLDREALGQTVVSAIDDCIAALKSQNNDLPESGHWPRIAFTPPGDDAAADADKAGDELDHEPSEPPADPEPEKVLAVPPADTEQLSPPIVDLCTAYVTALSTLTTLAADLAAALQPPGTTSRAASGSVRGALARAATAAANRLAPRLRQGTMDQRATRDSLATALDAARTRIDEFKREVSRLRAELDKDEWLASHPSGVQGVVDTQKGSLAETLALCDEVITQISDPRRTQFTTRRRSLAQSIQQATDKITKFAESSEKPSTSG